MNITRRRKIRKLELWLKKRFSDGSLLGLSDYEIAYYIVLLLEDYNSKTNSKNTLKNSIFNIFKNIYSKLLRRINEF